MDQSFMAPFALPEIPSVGPDIWERAARQGRPAARRTVKLMGEIFNIVLEKCSLQSAPERVLSPPPRAGNWRNGFPINFPLLCEVDKR